MTQESWERLKQAWGFGPDDEAVLSALYPAVKGRFAAMVEDFYSRLLEEDITRRILHQPSQVERLRATLAQWLDEVFQGPYDVDYRDRRRRVGRIHVEVGLPEVYVFRAMTRIRLQLQRTILEVCGEDREHGLRALAALGKVLDMDLALMAAAYHAAEKYRELVESSPDMIHELDRTGRLLTVNRTEQRVLGRSDDELVGRPFWELIPEEGREEARRHLQEIFVTGKGRCETRLLPAGRDPIDVEINAVGVPDLDQGEIHRVRCYVRDITDRKRAERALREERDRAQKYLDVAGVMIVIIGSDEKVRLINRKGCEILECPVQEVIGCNWFDTFIPKRLREEERAVFQKLRRGDTKAAGAHENPVLTRGGKLRTIEWHNTVLRDADDRIVATLSSGLDVTEKKRTARLLMEQASLARIGEMSAIVAHEVRNPLAGISGALHVVQGNLPPGTPDHSIIQEILNRISSLNETLNDLLYYARLRLPEPSPMAIQGLLEETIALLKKDPKLGGVEIACEGPDLVIPGDQELLGTVFQNLLLNSAQAMGGKGRISVTVGEEDGDCLITIADTGPGIPEDLRDKVFEPFFTTRTRGTGLGLPTARRVIESHCGRISLDCPPDGGTHVEVRLPLEANGGVA